VDAIFERSEQGVVVARRHHLGLGLSIAQRLIESEGGRVWADENDRDTAVRFTLRAARS
jgi:signal transduction histidine kinase